MQDVNVTDMNITEEMADENLTTELKEPIKVSRDGDHTPKIDYAS